MHYYRHWWIMYCIFWPAGKHIGTLLCHLLQDLKVPAQTSITIKNLLNLKWHRTFETQNIRLMFVHICGWKPDLQQTYKPYTLVRPGLKTGTRPPSCNMPREPTIYASTFSGYFAWTSVGVCSIQTLVKIYNNHVVIFSLFGNDEKVMINTKVCKSIEQNIC